MDAFSKLKANTGSHVHTHLFKSTIIGIRVAHKWCSDLQYNVN